VRREKTARALAKEFVELYGKRFPKAVSVFEAGVSDALIYLSYPGSNHHRHQPEDDEEHEKEGRDEQSRSH
jgi:hypothetical protein